MTATITTAAFAAAIDGVSIFTQRDKYRRSVRHFAITSGPRGNRGTICVRVSLPKVYRDKYGKAYMVTDWSTRNADGHNPVVECATVGEANAAIAAILVREKA